MMTTGHRRRQAHFVTPGDGVTGMGLQRGYELAATQPDLLMRFDQL